MNITCNNCHTKLNIPDHKLPADRESTITCPKCNRKIQVPAVSKAAQPMEAKPRPLVQMPFEDRQSALVCVEGAELKQKISFGLDQMGMNIEFANEMRSALTRMEYNVYQLLILDEQFDPNYKGAAGIMERMNVIDMSSRRKICIVLISRKFNTNDNMAALHYSVNAILHQDDVHHAESFFTKTLADYKNLYLIYNESLKMVGKA